MAPFMVSIGYPDSTADDMIKLAELGDAMRTSGIDAELLSRDQVARQEPLLDMGRDARFPIEGGLIQRSGGTARHDAVAWGYARGADRRGVDIIQNCEVTGIDKLGTEARQGLVALGKDHTGGQARRHTFAKTISTCWMPASGWCTSTTRSRPGPPGPRERHRRARSDSCLH